MHVMYAMRDWTAFAVAGVLLAAAPGVSAERAPGRDHGVARTTRPAARKGAGLRGEYFARSMALEGDPVLVRTDPGVDFDWGEGSPDGRVGANIFSVRWTGFLVAPASGRYTLHLSSDDGSRLWLDDELLVDGWSDHAMQEKAAEASLEAGVARRLRIEFYENMMYSGVRFEWTPPGSERQVVPAEHLFRPETDFTPPVVATVAAGGGRRHTVGSKVRVVVSEESGEEGLRGRLVMTSESAGYEGEVSGFSSLPDGVYLVEWDTSGLKPAEDYSLEVTLADAAGNVDADGLPHTPDLVVALDPATRICSLSDPQGGPPRPGCVSGGKAGGAAAAAMLLLCLSGALAVRRAAPER